MDTLLKQEELIMLQMKVNQAQGIAIQREWNMNSCCCKWKKKTTCQFECSIPIPVSLELLYVLTIHLQHLPSVCSGIRINWNTDILWKMHSHRALSWLKWDVLRSMLTCKSFIFMPAATDTRSFSSDTVSSGFSSTRTCFTAIWCA
jgi:hypothetical protein